MNQFSSLSSAVQVFTALYLCVAIGTVHQWHLVPSAHALVVQPIARSNVLSLQQTSFRLLNSLQDGEEGFVTAAYPPLESSTEMTSASGTTVTSNITFMSTTSSSSSSLTTTSTAQFGDVIPLKRKSSSSPALLVDSGSKDDTGTMSSTGTSTTTILNLADTIKRRNIGVAVVSIALAVMNYIWQYLHPLQPIQLLYQMEQQSSPITVIGTTNKPTVVDFWAPWCENCKLLAPTLLQMEEEYGKEINFVMINGDDPSAWPLIEAFGVDAIPHLALVEADGTVDTALIGPVPKQWLERDLQVLIDNAKLLNSDLYQQQDQDHGLGRTTGSKNEWGQPGVEQDTNNNDNDNNSYDNNNNRLLRPLPYQMLDVFANRPNERRIQVQTNVASNNP